MGGALKQLLPVMSPSFWSSLLLCFALLLLSCQPKDLHPRLPSTSLYPNFILFFIFSDHPLPASKRSLNATLPISFLNLDLVSLSETRFSTKRFPSDTAEEKYVSIVCEALLCPDYHTDRWITHIPPLPSNKLPAGGPRRLHTFCAVLKSHPSDSLDFPREKNKWENQLRIWRAKRRKMRVIPFPTLGSAGFCVGV